MRIVIPDDYQNAVRGLACFSKLAGHEVTVFTDAFVEGNPIRVVNPEVLERHLGG